MEGTSKKQKSARLHQIHIISLIRGYETYLANAYVYLAIAIVAEIIGTSALKASDGFSKLVPSLIVVAGFGVAFYFLALCLRVIPVGVAYAIWSGVGITLISLVGWLVFKQPLDLPAIIGISLIIAGVVVLNFFFESRYALTAADG